MNNTRRFIFRGNASGISAHIRKPTDWILPVQAASSLPVTGGVSESKAGPNAPDSHVHFLSAETAARGDFAVGGQPGAIGRHSIAPGADPTQTMVTSAVRGLQIGPRFAAGLAQVNLHATSPLPGSTHPSIRIQDSKLEGVIINGHALQIHIDNDTYSRCDTLDALKNEYRDKFSEQQRACFYRPAGPATRELYLSGGVAYGTIVGGIKWVGDKPDTGVTQTGPNSFLIDNFGAVFFGEILVSDAYRRVTMIRIQLGVTAPSAHVPLFEEFKAEDARGDDGSGEVCAAEGETNGQHWPV